jgi:quercetin dioxygenase-like cupin family protein
MMPGARSRADAATGVWPAFLGAFAVGAALSACRAPSPPQAPSEPALAVEPLPAGKIRRTLIEQRPVTGLSGWETRLYLVEYGPGAVAPVHVHPAVGVGFVLEGSFESAFEGEPVRQVHAGQGFVDSAGVAHRAFRNLSSDRTLRFVIAYTIRSGDEMFYPGPSLPSVR